MDLIDDVLVLHLASYCDARSRLSLALASKRYGMKPSTDIEVTISPIMMEERKQLNVHGL